MLYISQMDARAAELARERGLGLELIEFCAPERLEDEAALARWSGELRRFAAASLHAPFAELFPCAVDREVRSVARRRLLRAGEVCARLGVRRMIAHSGCAPRLYFPEWYVPQSIEFWRELLRELPEGVELLLENVLDPEPSELAAIVDGVGDPRLGVCLDIGHANVYSPRPVSEWISTLGARIRHVHLHNNGGDRDAHAPLGEGSMDIPPLLAMLQDRAPEADWCIESRDAEVCLHELERLGFEAGNLRVDGGEGTHRATIAQESRVANSAAAMGKGEQSLANSSQSGSGNACSDTKGRALNFAENMGSPRDSSAVIPDECLSANLPDPGASATFSCDVPPNMQPREDLPSIPTGNSIADGRSANGTSAESSSEGEGASPEAPKGEREHYREISQGRDDRCFECGSSPEGRPASGEPVDLAGKCASTEVAGKIPYSELISGRDARCTECDQRAEHGGRMDGLAIPALPFDPCAIHIPAPDATAMAAAEARQRMLAKPPGSLGVLEEISIRFAGMTGRERNRARRRRLLVFAADNGVTAEGVSSAPKSVTLAQTVNLARGMTGAATLARHFDAELRVYDVGVDAPGPLGGGVVHRRIANGTRNLAVGPAMTRDQVLAALHVGYDAAAEAADAGMEIIGIGEMGIGNTTTSAAVLSALLNLPADVTVGRGGGVNDAGFARKREIVDMAVARLNGAKDAAVAQPDGAKDAAVARLDGAKDAVVARPDREKDAALARLNGAKSEAVSRLGGAKGATVARLGGAKDATVVRPDCAKDAVVAHLNGTKDAVVRPDCEIDAALARLNGEQGTAVARLDGARDAAVVRLNCEQDEAVVRPNCEQDAAVARPDGTKDAMVARSDDEKDAAVVRLNGEQGAAVARLDGAKDAAVVRLNCEQGAAAVRLDGEKDAAVARTDGAKDATVVQPDGEMGAALARLDGAKDAVVARLDGEKDATVARLDGEKDAALVLSNCEHGAAVVRPNGAKDVVNVLAEVGGLDIAAMCGAFIGAAARRLPAVIDGYISVVAALCAERLAPGCRNYMFASHASWERGYARAVEALGLKPMLALEMRLGEGSGCPLAFAVIDAALMVHDEMATFEQARIDDGYLSEIRGDARLQR